jgi:phosphatidylinositol alpha-1,6-mannosyltransferase
MTADIQISAQHLAAGAGGIARCARLSLKALAGEARLTALAVEDRAAEVIDGLRTRPFRGVRSAFVAANTIGALKSDWTIYDFAGTARAHGPLALAGRPYAVWAHGWEIWPGNLRDDYAAALRGAAAVFANSAHTAARLAESVPDLRRVFVCPLGTEADLAPRPAAAREPRVLFVGRNDAMFAKGQDRLIAAWPAVLAEVPEARLCFVGGGDRLGQLRAMVAASPAAAAIEVLGQLSDAEVSAQFSRARLFAMLSNVEGFGLVYAEAMSHGLPVLSADADASSEVNRDGETGLTVDRDDTASVARGILSLLRDDALRERLSRAAFERWTATYAFSAFRKRFLGAAADAGLLQPAARPAVASA